MKKRLIISCLVAALVSVAALLLLPVRKTPGKGQRSDQEIAERLDQFLTQQEADGFAGIVLVAKGDHVLLQKGYGLADRENSIPFNEHTVFTVGSITKQFTGAAVMKLVMDGKVKLDDTIDRFFDDVPADKRGITLHHLLTHTAGIPDGLGDDFDTRATKEWIVERVMHCQLLSPPGEAHAYSNVGYSLLAAIIEEVSDQGYESFLREQLFQPAQMLHTGYVLPQFAPQKLAVGYRGQQRWGTVLGRPMLDDGPCWNLRGNGGIHSTIGDMLKWHQALIGNDILSKKAKQLYFAPHVDEGYGDSFYGYGWVNWTTDWQTRLLSHNGGNGYFSADCHRYVEDDVLIFLAANGDVKAWDLMDQLETIAFDCD